MRFLTPLLAALLVAATAGGAATAAPSATAAKKKAPTCKTAEQMRSAPCKRLDRSCRKAKQRKTRRCRALARRKAALKRKAQGAPAPQPQAQQPQQPSAPPAASSRRFTGTLGSEPLTFDLRDGAIHDVSSIVWYQCGGWLNNNPVEIPGPIPVGADGSFDYHYDVTDHGSYDFRGTLSGGHASGELEVKIENTLCYGTTKWTAQG